MTTNIIPPTHEQIITETVNTIIKKTKLHYNNNIEDVKSDIYQTAYLAALEAYQTYKQELTNNNLDFKNAFFNYAYFQIYDAIIKEYSFANKNAFKDYRYNKLKAFNQIKQFVNNYYEEKKEFPPDEIILQKFNVNKDIYYKRIKPYLKVLTIAQEISLASKNDKDLSLLDILGTNDSEKIEKDIYKKQIIDKILHYVKEHCAERTYEIFRMRYGLDDYKDKEFTYKEIGEKFEISQERVRQVLAKVLKDVKKYLKDKNIIEPKIDQNLQN